MNESELDHFKNLKFTSEYHHQKIEKLQKQINPLQADKGRLEEEIEEIDGQVQILDCCIDKLALEREVINWQNRRQRTLERIFKILKSRDEITQLRISLNEKWKLLTHDSQEFIPPLTLKADSEMFFI